MEMKVLLWVLTYAIHSTVLILSVWLLTKFFRRISLGTQEVLWKAALLGGLATASLQLATGLTPPWGHFALPASLDTAPVAITQTQVESPEPAGVERRIVKHNSGDLTITTIRESRPAAAAIHVTETTSPMKPSVWPWLLLGLIGFGSVFALFRLWMASRRLNAKLAPRRDVLEDPVLDAFLGLCQKAELTGKKKRVRLTASSHLRSPVALRTREVVIPERAVERLTAPQQESMLAHELAHIIRRDPTWSVFTAVVEALFFFQPLNHLARRKLQEVAEFQCDDWAARQTGSGVHLAKCLAEVAAWLEAGSGANPLAVAMADEGSPIVRRITRLLNRSRKLDDAESTTAFALRIGATLGLLGAAVWLIPGVSRGAHKVEGSLEEGDAKYLGSAAFVADRGNGEREVVIRDVRGEDGRKRSQVRIDRDDEVVRVEVERAEVVAPPPPPPPPQSGGLHIHGFIHDAWPFGGGHGHIEVDIDDDISVNLDGMFGAGFPFDEPCDDDADDGFDLFFSGGGGHHRHHAERERHRAERERDRAERHRDRMERHRAKVERKVHKMHEKAARMQAKVDRYRESAAENTPSQGVPPNGVFDI